MPIHTALILTTCMLGLVDSSTTTPTPAPAPAAKIAHAAGAAVSIQDGAADPIDVRATFTRADDGAPGKVIPAAPPKARVSAPWDRPERDIPADLRAAELPTYYVYQGHAVRLRVDGSRILIKFAAVDTPVGRTEAVNAARALGMSVVDAHDIGVPGYAALQPAAELVGEGGVNAALELLLTDPRFEYAAPIYHNPEVDGGITAMLPEINLRVTEANADRAADIIRDVAKNAEVVRETIANLVGSAQIRFDDRNGFAVLRRANELAMNPALAWASPTQLTSMDLHDYIPNDPFWGDDSMWGWFNNGAGSAIADMDTDAELAWDLTRGSGDVRVLCLDLGSDQDHPDIHQLTGRTFTDGSVAGFGTGEPVTACDNHGTAVAGIVAGRVNNSIGGAGVAPGVWVISAKVGQTPLPPAGQSCGNSWGGTGNAAGNTLDVRIANALAWGEGQNCRISNGSYGTGESDLLTDTYNDTAANGMLHFASAGNGGADNIGDNALGYPARLANVQAVAAIDSDGGRSSFSNYGTGLDFSAPGTNVRSTDRAGSVGYTGNDYCTFSGTSAASPFAAGCAALIWSAYPDWTAAGIVNLMRFYATDLGAAGYDTGYGWGFPNVNDSIRSVFPQNNWCDMATTITTTAYNPATYSTANASEVPEELNELCVPLATGVNHSVWYRYVVPCNGHLNINTNGSNYDTVLSILVGSCTFAIPIGCDDDGGTGLQSQLDDVSVQAGQICYIKVSAYGENGAGGLLDFNFLFEPTAYDNDECGNAFDIPFNQLSLTTCTLGATTTPCEGGETCEAGDVGTGHSVWYQFHTPSVGRFNLNTIGSGYDTVLSVWRGSCGTYIDFNGQALCTTLPISVACNDDAAGTLQSRINNLAVDGNTTYRFKVAAYGDNPGGEAVFNFEFVPCPADFNVSGALTVQDIFDFLTAYFAGDPRANFNYYGGITVQDIFDFLAAYFEGCA